MDVKLDLTSLGGGAAQEDFDAALDNVTEGLLDADLMGKPRKIVLEVTLTPKDDGFVTTTHTVKVTLPSRQRTGVAWTEGGELKTSLKLREDRQLFFPEDTPDGRITQIGGRRAVSRAKTED